MRLRYPRRTNIERFLIYRILISLVSRLCQIHNEKTGYYLWSPCTRQTGRERPPVVDNPALRDTAGNTAARNLSRTFLLSPGRRILIEEEVFTPPRGGGGVRPLSLRVYHVRYEPYLNLFRMVFRRTVCERVVRVRRTLGRRWIC